MKNFSVIISFMKSAKCCDFEVKLDSADKDDAYSSAVDLARSSDLNGLIKSVKVTEMTP